MIRKYSEGPAGEAQYARDKAKALNAYRRDAKKFIDEIEGPFVLIGVEPEDEGSYNLRELVAFSGDTHDAVALAIGVKQAHKDVIMGTLEQTGDESQHYLRHLKEFKEGARTTEELFGKSSDYEKNFLSMEDII